MKSKSGITAALAFAASLVTREDAAIMQDLSTLRGTLSGAPTDTDLRGTFVWVRRDARWRLVTNQLTAVGP